MLPSCFTPGIFEAGVDEAGRGCLAGPVFAAAVILPDDFSHPAINDSKQISEKKREALRDIIENEAVAWAVGIVDNTEIDRLNILNASILAMHRALEGLTVRPGAIIVDGNRFKPWGDTPWTTFVKGDGRFANIAAASILAKTHRDEYMCLMAEKYPGISPYIYCAGNPIAYIDPDGMQIFVNIDDMIYYYREIEKGRYGFVDEDGNEYEGTDNFIYSVEQALNTLREGEAGRTLVDEMVSCSDNFCITPSVNMDDSWFGVDKTMVNGIECYIIGWDSSSIKGGPSMLPNESVSRERPSFISLGHELAHGQDRVYGRWDSSTWFVNNLDITTKADIYATHIENMIRAEHGLPLRTHYDSRVPNSRIIMDGNLSIYYAPFRYRIRNF